MNNNVKNPKPIKNVCVFSSSSNKLDKIYYEAAEELGILMAKAGFNLVYGGGTLGTMGVNADAVKEFGAQVTGVLPEKLYKIGVGNARCDELFVTEGMRTRKDKLDKISDAVIAMPGGFGTLEELTEMIVQKQLGYNQKAIVILNTNGFYGNLIKFFDDIVRQNFAHTTSKTIYYIANTPQEAVDYLKNFEPADENIISYLKSALKS